LAAGTPGRGFNLVALATIVTQAVVFDGPLLQRASTIISKPMTADVNVTAPIAQEIPCGYTGYASGLPDATGPSITMNQTFAKVVNSYITREPITTSFMGFSGNCSGSIRATGLAVDCEEKPAPWINNLNLLNSTEEFVISSSFEWIPSTTLNPDYYTDGTNPWPLYPFIDFKLLYATGRIANLFADDPGFGMGSCNWTLVTNRCSMRSAMLLYPINMINNTVTISGNSSSFPVDHI
jgi:hypothetical protein